MPRKKQDPLHEAVLALLDIPPPQRETPEVRARWLTLWEAHFAGEKMVAANVHLADLMTFMGASQKMVDGAYPTALAYLDTFFTPPQSAQADKISLMELHKDRLICLLHLGQETPAIEIGYALLSYERRSDLRTSLLTVQAPLYLYLLQCDPEQTATVELTEFVWDVAQAIYSRKRRRLPSPATFAPLCEALNQTWPKSIREEVRECWSDYIQERNLWREQQCDMV